MYCRYRAQGFWPIYPVRGAPHRALKQLMYFPASPHMQGTETAARGGANGALPISMYRDPMHREGTGGSGVYSIYYTSHATNDEV
jgi:hypothetical protein